MLCKNPSIEDSEDLSKRYVILCLRSKVDHTLIYSLHSYCLKFYVNRWSNFREGCLVIEFLICYQRLDFKRTRVTFFLILSKNMKYTQISHADRFLKTSAVSDMSNIQPNNNVSFSCIIPKAIILLLDLSPKAIK